MSRVHFHSIKIRFPLIPNSAFLRSLCPGFHNPELCHFPSSFGFSPSGHQDKFPPLNTSKTFRFTETSTRHHPSPSLVIPIAKEIWERCCSKSLCELPPAGWLCQTYFFVSWRQRFLKRRGEIQQIPRRPPQTGGLTTLPLKIRMFWLSTITCLSGKAFSVSSMSPSCVYREEDGAEPVRFFFFPSLCLSTKESILSTLFPLCYSEPITWWGD